MTEPLYWEGRYRTEHKIAKGLERRVKELERQLAIVEARLDEPKFCIHNGQLGVCCDEAE